MCLTSAVHNRRILRNIATEIIGETVGRGTQISRLAAKEIINLDRIVFNGTDRDELMAELAYLAFRLANLSTYFRRKLLNEPVPYSADGISFPALVQLVRIEENLFGWGWLPEHVRALGLAINPGDELVGASGLDSYTIKDRRGNCREFYRYH